MKNFFDMDSPFISGLNRMADMMILNLITIICCLPVITIGASITALHFVTLKMVRNEETYIVKTFFRSFKQNFIQSTIIWVLELLLLGLMIVDFSIINHSGIAFPFWVNLGLIAVCVLVYALLIHVFPLQARFENKIIATIKNSILVGLMIFPKTVLEVIICAVPIAVIYFFESALPLIILFGFSLPAYVCALLYSSTFKKFEPEVENSGDEWFIEPLEKENTSDCPDENSGELSESESQDINSEIDLAEK